MQTEMPVEIDRCRANTGRNGTFRTPGIWSGVQCWYNVIVWRASIAHPHTDTNHQETCIRVKQSLYDSPYDSASVKIVSLFRLEHLNLRRHGNSEIVAAYKSWQISMQPWVHINQGTASSHTRRKARHNRLNRAHRVSFPFLEDIDLSIARFLLFDLFETQSSIKAFYPES
jgi:hypothetical protein